MTQLTAARKTRSKPANVNGHSSNGKPLKVVVDDPRYDPQAETAVIGAVFLNSERLQIPAVAELREGDFFLEPHRRIWKVVRNEHANGRPLNPQVITRILDDQPGEKLSIGFLSKLIDGAGTGYAAEYFAKIVRKKAALRRGESLADEIKRLIADGCDPETIQQVIERYRDDQARIDGVNSVQLLTAADLSEGEFTVDYHVHGILAKGQPCIVAAPQKTLKTSICLDLAISLATGRQFLGKWQTNQCRVLMLSGESGVGALQSCARRICESKNVILSAIDGFTLSTWLPRFASDSDLMQLRGIIGKTSAEVLFIDPAYLAMAGDDAGNLFVMGESLRGISQLCQELKVTLVLVHHMRKPNKQHGSDKDLPELTDIAWSGFAEFARQWVLMKRRKPYEPGSGLHELWFVCGGSAGHGGGWGLDVDEGAGDERIWSTTLRGLGEVAAESSTASFIEQEARRDFRKAAAETEKRDRVLAAIVAGGAVTITTIGKETKLSHAVIRTLCQQLLELGEIEDCEAETSGRHYPGFRATQKQEPGQPGQPRTNAANSGLSDPDRTGGSIRTPVRPSGSGPEKPDN